MIIIFQEKPFFRASLLKNFGRFLGGSISAFAIFLIVFHTCKSEPRSRKSLDVLDSSKLDKNSTKVDQHQRNENKTLEGYLRRESLNKTNKSASKNKSQSTPTVMIQQNNSSYVMLSPIHSSHFHNLIDLLSHHSLVKSENNNIKNVTFGHDHSDHHKTDLPHNIDPFKSKSNMSESVPYFDMLYDLALDFNPVYSEKLDQPSCKPFNFSVSNDGLYPSNAESVKNKKYLGCDWNDLSGNQKKMYLEVNQGPRQRFSKNQAIPLTIYYGALLAVGVPGNLLTCLIITTNSYMRTPPNFFLLNLAATDLLTLTLIPIEIILFWKHYPWPLGTFGCAIASILSELVSYVSIGTMICFTMERYTAICHPLKPSLHSGKRRTIYIIVAIWIICFVPSAWWLIYGKIQYMYYSPWKEDRFAGMEEETSLQKQGYVRTEESATCMIAETSVSSTMLTITGTTFILLYLLPITALPIIYSRIAKAMRDSITLSVSNTTGTAENRNRKTVVRIQIAVIVCFLICWTPYHIERILFVIANMKKQWKKFHSLHETLHVTSGCCFFLSSVVNPFLYSLLSKRFRRGYQDLLRKIKKWILNLPHFLRFSNPPTNNSICQNDRRMNPAVDLNKTTPSQEEREGLVNSMCCTGMMVKQSIYRWKTCKTRNQDTGHRKLKSQNLPNCQIEVSVYRDELEMKNIPKKGKLDRYSAHESDSDIFYSAGSSIPMTEKNTTLLFVSEPMYEPLSKSEEDFHQRSSLTYNTSANSPILNNKRRASESNTQPLINDDMLKKKKSRHKSKSYGNLLPKIRNSMSFAFHTNINSSCLP